jgi:hypothetical protein
VDSRHTFEFAVRAMIFFLFSQAAPVAILLSALFSELYSLGARWVFSFSRCCYRIGVLSSHLFGGSWAPGLNRSHLDSAAELAATRYQSLLSCCATRELGSEIFQSFP